MKKLELKPGQKYRGYGLLNEFGEFEFIPEDTGSRKENIKTLKTGSGFSVSYSKQNLMIHIKIKHSKRKMSELVVEFATKFNQIVDIIKKHEF